MINLMKSVVLTVALVCSVFTFSFSNDMLITEYPSFKGGVTVEGDMLVSSSDEVDDTILVVYLINDSGKMYEFFGCSDSECSIKISHIPKGHYEVIVVSKYGGFDADIVIS